MDGEAKFRELEKECRQCLGKLTAAMAGYSALKTQASQGMGWGVGSAIGSAFDVLHTYVERIVDTVDWTVKHSSAYLSMTRDIRTWQEFGNTMDPIASAIRPGTLNHRENDLGTAAERAWTGYIRDVYQSNILDQYAAARGVKVISDSARDVLESASNAGARFYLAVVALAVTVIDLLLGRLKVIAVALQMLRNAWNAGSPWNLLIGLAKEVVGQVVKLGWDVWKVILALAAVIRTYYWAHADIAVSIKSLHTLVNSSLDFVHGQWPSPATTYGRAWPRWEPRMDGSGSMSLRIGEGIFRTE